MTGTLQKLFKSHYGTVRNYINEQQNHCNKDFLKSFCEWFIPEENFSLTIICKKIEEEKPGFIDHFLKFSSEYIECAIYEYLENVDYFGIEITWDLISKAFQSTLDLDTDNSPAEYFFELV